MSTRSAVSRWTPRSTPTCSVRVCPTGVARARSPRTRRSCSGERTSAGAPCRRVLTIRLPHDRGRRPGCEPHQAHRPPARPGRVSYDPLQRGGPEPRDAEQPALLDRNRFPVVAVTPHLWGRGLSVLLGPFSSLAPYLPAQASIVGM